MIAPWITSVLVGLGVGLAHYAGHSIAGNEENFDEAGVMAAGATVVIGATVATYVVLVLAGVA